MCSCFSIFYSVSEEFQLHEKILFSITENDVLARLGKRSDFIGIFKWAQCFISIFNLLYDTVWKYLCSVFWNDIRCHGYSCYVFIIWADVLWITSISVYGLAERIERMNLVILPIEFYRTYCTVNTRSKNGSQIV